MRIPFLVLVGKDGKVDSLHVRGPKLRSRLVALLGDPADAPATEKPADSKNLPRKSPQPRSPPPKSRRPKDRQTPADEAAGSRSRRLALRWPRRCSRLMSPLPLPAVATAEDPAINPYAAKPGLTTEQLVNYILKMLDKPKTIQARPGFCEAVCEACDRADVGQPAGHRSAALRGRRIEVRGAAQEGLHGRRRGRQAARRRSSRR